MPKASLRSLFSSTVALAAVYFAMIPLIAYTPRLTLLAASRALLTAELHKPQYFPMLLGAAMPADWPPGEHNQ